MKEGRCGLRSSNLVVILMVLIRLTSSLSVLRWRLRTTLERREGNWELLDSLADAQTLQKSVPAATRICIPNRGAFSTRIQLPADVERDLNLI
eukprot:IDg11286t1